MADSTFDFDSSKPKKRRCSCTEINGRHSSTALGSQGGVPKCYCSLELENRETDLRSDICVPVVSLSCPVTESKTVLNDSILTRPSSQSNASSQLHENEKERNRADCERNGETSSNSGFRFSSDLTLEEVRQMQANFADERNWNQFHTPRNLLLAMVGEVGEVSELFQWRSEVAVGLPDWSAADRTHLSEELSDVLIYLIRLAEQCHVDLPDAVRRKIALNRLKYPVDLVYGSSKKYNQYADDGNQSEINNTASEVSKGQ